MARTKRKQMSEGDKSLFSSLPVALILVTPDEGRIVDANPAAGAMFGVTPGRLTGSLLREMFAPEDQAIIDRRIASAASGDPALGRSRSGGVSGTVSHIGYRIDRIELQGTVFLAVTGRDLGEIHEVERRYRELFEQSSEPIILIDRASDQIVDCNPELERLVGRTREDLLRLSLGDLVHREGLKRVHEARESAHDDFETTMVRPEGREVHVRIRIGTFPFEGREFIVAFIRDLRHELRSEQLEEKLAQARRLESLGQMASGIAHDFNNTLMAALPWADLLRRKYPDDELIQKAATHVRDTIYRARDVTRQLLEFAQPKIPQRSRADLRELVTRSEAIIARLLGADIALEIDHADEEIPVEIDPGQVTQVVLNLIMNAKEALRGGGNVRIETEVIAADEATRRGLERKPWGALRIVDDGPGIADVDIPRVFDPYFTTKELGHGVGLGLSVAHRVMQKHGGAINIESTRGRGTAIELDFPLTATQPVSVPAEASDRHRIVCLIVDDEPEVSEGIAALLDLEGVSVEMAETGSDALRIIGGGFRPDFVILDLGLPDMGGDEVFREIRKIHRDLPIVISTGYGDTGTLEELLSDERSLYRQKPFDVNELMDQIIDILNRQGS